ncbi:hypothetical protein [Haloflavibacter putidus]|uniref:Uncharacterized protein n=1 Tax=Haloflavibacter putidus TaxID=2576776 RepID=A0A507ZW59_9FLAO|nr:hypothetical protein [Haloflavibacter putidus]TQD39015.1 hypothetical protein FKR84_06350 [Haloflavibacter putidus]
MELYKKIFSDFGSEYYMHATLGIILSSCLGAAAAMLILTSGHQLPQMVQLFWITAVCMSFNAAVLANVKKDIVFTLLIISLISSALFILYHVFTL